MQGVKQHGAVSITVSSSRPRQVTSPVHSAVMGKIKQNLLNAFAVSYILVIYLQ